MATHALRLGTGNCGVVEVEDIVTRAVEQAGALLLCGSEEKAADKGLVGRPCVDWDDRGQEVLRS